MPEPLIRSISDTARWVAYHRATESDRPDAIFRDPHARSLAGERGEAHRSQAQGQRLGHCCSHLSFRQGYSGTARPRAH